MHLYEIFLKQVPPEFCWPSGKIQPVTEHVPPVKPKASQSAASRMKIVVRTPDGQELYFSLNLCCPMHKVMTAFCKHVGAGLDVEVRILYDGRRIFDEDTPEKLGMEHGGEVHVSAMTTQTGC